MPGRMLLFVHAALGTLGIVVAQLAEKVATEKTAQEAKVLRAVEPWIMYTMIFLGLLLLDWVVDEFKRRRGRHLKESGNIEGCWLERSSRRVEDKMEYELGVFITIRYIPETQFFRVEGEAFEPSGRWFGQFVGHGRPDHDGTKLMYYYEGKRGGLDDTGAGHFIFRGRHNRADAFSGSFHGASTDTVRHVDGDKTENLPVYLTDDQRKQEQSKRIVEYLKKQPLSFAATLK